MKVQSQARQLLTQQEPLGYLHAALIGCLNAASDSAFLQLGEVGVVQHKRLALREPRRKIDGSRHYRYASEELCDTASSLGCHAAGVGAGGSRRRALH